jgi:hypothetical protein
MSRWFALMSCFFLVLAGCRLFEGRPERQWSDREISDFQNASSISETNGGLSKSEQKQGRDELLRR